MDKASILQSIPPYLLRSKNYAVTITDLHGNYLFFNDLFKEKYNQLNTNKEGNSFLSGVHPDEATQITNAAFKCIQNPNETVLVELKKIEEDKHTYFWTSWEFSAFKNSENEVVGIICIGHDISESKRSTKLLQESNSKLASIYNSTQESYLLISPDYKIIAFNKAAEKYTKLVLGQTLEEYDPIEKVLIPETKDVFYVNSKKALAGESVKQEFQVKGYWFEFVFYPVYDGKELIGFSMSSLLIDERKKAEEYRKALLNSIPDMFFVMNKEGVFIDYKADVKDLYLSPDQFLNKNILDVMPSEMANLVFGGITQCLEKHETVELSFALDINGKTRYFQSRINPLWKDQVTVVSRDITSRTLAELKLKESEHQLQRTLESIPDPMLIVNDDTSIIYVNKEFTSTFGYEKAEVLDKKIDFLIPERYRLNHYALHERYLKKGGNSMRMGRYITALTKSGEEVTIDGSLNTFHANGKRYVIVIFKDVTEFKNRQDIIEAQNKVFREIAWVQSHELRNPVSNILGLYDLIKASFDESKELNAEYLTMLQKSTQDLDRIIHQIVEKASKNNFNN